MRSGMSGGQHGEPCSFVHPPAEEVGGGLVEVAARQRAGAPQAREAGRRLVRLVGAAQVGQGRRPELGRLLLVEYAHRHGHIIDDAIPSPATSDRVTHFNTSAHGSPLCQDAVGRAVLGLVPAGPGSGLSEVPVWGCEPVAMESESLPRCPPGLVLEPAMAWVIASSTMVL
jgi:hypothetical protein